MLKQGFILAGDGSLVLSCHNYYLLALTTTSRNGQGRGGSRNVVWGRRDRHKPLRAFAARIAEYPHGDRFDNNGRPPRPRDRQIDEAKAVVMKQFFRDEACCAHAL
jgi:hypothetical protein